SQAARVSAASSSLGRIVVDGRGRTLYLFEKDSHGRSACSGSCAMYWPPVITRGKPIAGRGLKRSLLGTIRRDSGARPALLRGRSTGTYWTPGLVRPMVRLAGIRCRLGRALARREKDREWQ